jgi:hypothetical protein
MKGKTVLILLALLMIVGISEEAFSYGNEPEPGSCAYEPTGKITGPYLKGTFTVARDKLVLQYGSEEPQHYNVQFLLKWGNRKHLFSFFATLLDNDYSWDGVGDPPDCYDTFLCGVQASDLMEWDEFGNQPCILGVGEAFGLEGTPVIVELEITERDFCGCEDAMIAGTIIIGVVPPEE